MNHPLRVSCLLLCAAALGVGCNRQEAAIRTYSAPKDLPAPQVAAADLPSADNPDSASPDAAPSKPILWTVPASWKEVPSDNQMRFATFQVSTDDPKAQVTVVRLPAEAATLLPNVNRWAGQLKLPQVSEADLSKVTTQTQVSGEQATVVDMTGSSETGNPPTRLLAAIIPHEDSAWFFTLKAPAPLVEAQKATFEKFLHSIQFPTAGASASADNRAEASESVTYKLAKWKTPQGWQEQPGANTMRVTSFRVGPDDQHTEVIVSKIPVGGFGSIPDNLNRWRGQVGLPPVERPEPDSKAEINIAGHGGLLMAFKGPAEAPTPARTALIAMDQEGRDFWFIKMLGPDSVVSKQQANFQQFLDSLQFEQESH